MEFWQKTPLKPVDLFSSHCLVTKSQNSPKHHLCIKSYIYAAFCSWCYISASEVEHSQKAKFAFLHSSFTSLLSWENTNIFFDVLYSADSKGTPKLIREKREPSFKVVAAGYSVDLDCRFKDPYSLDSVTLSKGSTGKQTPRIVDGVKISKSGQIFTINDFQKSDEGRYWCKLGSWSYRIESLYVVSRTQPGMKYLFW